MNTEYTNSWIVDFDEKKVLKYHNKFYCNFEKNVKHSQQIVLIQKYLRQDMEWLDAPIGSGRLMDELTCAGMYGFDKSPAFAQYNNAKGRPTTEGDLFHVPFTERFDLITCLHTLFAFDDCKTIISQLGGALKQDGILIADIVNKEHIEASTATCGEYPYKSAMTQNEIVAFFEQLNFEVLDIQLHDFYDNRFILAWRNKGNRVTKLFKRALFKLCNILYFRLGLSRLFISYSQNHNSMYYTKYLVAAKKRGQAARHETRL